MTKRCARCGKDKPVSMFKRTRKRKGIARPCNALRTTEDGRRRTCHACNKTAQRRKKGVLSRAERKALAANRHADSASSRDSQLRQFQRLLSRLLTKRCEEEGTCRATTTYRAKYRLDPAYREREIARTWARKGASGILRTDARWARPVEDDGTLTSTVIRDLFARAQRCPYCGDDLTPREKTLDHVMPVSKGGAHSIANVVVCCSSCNSKKGRRTPEQWMRLSA